MTATLTILGQQHTLVHPDPNQVQVCDVCGGSGQRRFRGECDTCPRCKGRGQIQQVQPGGVRVILRYLCGCERPLELPAKAGRIGPIHTPGYLDDCGRTCSPDGHQIIAISWAEAEQRSVGRTNCAACAAVGEMPERVAA